MYSKKLPGKNQNYISAQSLIKNYGWPSWFGKFTNDPADFKAVDDYNSV